MPQVVRFGISLENDLLSKFDQRRKVKKYSNRSEAIRDLIREDLVKAEWQENKEIAGAITLIYDHHKRELVNKLMVIQHDFGNIIISSQHIHLDHNNCLEIIAVKGTSNKLTELSDKLIGIKGIIHGKLVMSRTE